MNDNYLINSEKSVLSSFLFDYNTFNKLHKELYKESFYHLLYGEIFQTMKDLHKQELPIDEDFIIKELKKDNKQVPQFEAALVEILTANPVANIQAYIKEIQTAHTDRAIKQLSIELQKGLSINDFKIKLGKIENLYKKEENKEEQYQQIEFEKLSPFLANITKDLMSINNYPPSMVLTTVLSSMAGLIGARAKITNGVNLTVYPVIWSMIVAPSSVAAKSTLFRFSKKCIFDDMQNELFDEYEGDLEQYKADLKRFQALPKEDKMREVEPERPHPKLLIFANDGTPEAKILSLHRNQNGGVVYYDEMKAELERSNNDPRYKALKTSIFDGETYHKELVRDGGTFILRNPVLSEVGLITEQWLMESVQKNDIASGFMARYLFSYNTRADFKPLQIQKHILDCDHYSDVGRFVLDTLGIDREESLLFNMTLEAKNHYIKWFNDFSRTAFATETDEEITASYRLSTYVLKFALIVHIFNSAYQKIDLNKDYKPVDLDSIKTAIYIMEIFQNENHKILSLFEKNKKLNFKIDDVTVKLQKKIRASEEKMISKTEASNGIRGLTSTKLNELIEQGLFLTKKVDRKTYILEA